MSVNFYLLACVKALELSFNAPLAKSFTFFLTLERSTVTRGLEMLESRKVPFKNLAS